MIGLNDSILLLLTDDAILLLLTVLSVKPWILLRLPSCEPNSLVPLLSP